MLVFAGPKTMSELAVMEQVKVPTMSRLVAAIEAENANGRTTLSRARALRLSLLESLLSKATAGEIAERLVL